MLYRNVTSKVAFGVDCGGGQYRMIGGSEHIRLLARGLCGSGVHPQQVFSIPGGSLKL